MKRSKYMFSVTLFLSLLIGILCLPAALAGTAGQDQFPEGVVVIPAGTEVLIDDDHQTVSIKDNPVQITEGDTFIIYLQDLPIGYIARTVTIQDSVTVIATEKADKSVYALLKEKGEMKLTPDMYDFIPAEGVSYTIENAGSPSISIADRLKYEDGKLTVSLMKGNGGKTDIQFSNLRLSHSFSDGNISLELNGNWKITLKTTGDSLGEVPLGEIRVYGVGKIALSINIEMSIECSFAGSFSAGFNTSENGDGEIRKEFSVSKSSVEEKGEIALSLKLSAGIDVLVAEADIYAEIGVKTNVSSKVTTHDDRNPPITVHCEDFKIYLFSTVGAEVKYGTPDGSKKKIASAEFALIDENNSPFLLDVHFENGVRSAGCTEGMSSSIEPEAYHYGGKASSFGSTLLSTERERILENDINLPWDITTVGDYYIYNGRLDLNGNTLTINGDLIQSGGVLDVADGTLIVHGNYRLQTKDNERYLDSNGKLIMSSQEGKAIIDGDVYVQTNDENKITSGKLFVGGDIFQISTSSQQANFNPKLELTLTSGRNHTIYLASPANNQFGEMILEADTSIPSDFYSDTINVNGHHLTIEGNHYSVGPVDIGGGNMTVLGNMLHSSDIITMNRGVLQISGNYYGVAADSVFNGDPRGIKGGHSCLQMIYAEDEVHIEGDVIVKNNTYSTLPEHELKAGTLYLGGSFTQLNGSLLRNFAASAEHITVFNGTGRQEICFENEDCGFGTVRSTNDQLVFTGNVGWIKQDSDLHAFSENGRLVTSSYRDGIYGHENDLETFDVNGKQLFIEGNLAVSSSINLNGGQMIVDGTVLHDCYLIKANKGKLWIRGNYYGVGADSALNGDPRGIKGGHSCLQMIYAEDEVHIEGDVIVKNNTYSTLPEHELKAGTLYLGGSFTQLNGSLLRNFAASAEHITVFNGTGRQEICFENEDCGFGTVRSTNDQLVFTGNIGWIKQDSDLHAFSENGRLVTSSYRDGIYGQENGLQTFDVNGYQLTIVGNVVLSSAVDLNGGKLMVEGMLIHDRDVIYLNEGKLHVVGNYYGIGKDSDLSAGTDGMIGVYSGLKMIHEDDEAYIDGDAIVKNREHELKAGTLYLRGNFTQLKWSSINIFKAEEGHKTILDGPNQQIVLFENTKCSFGTLIITKPKQTYVFNPDPCWIELIEMFRPEYGIPEFVLPASLQAIEEFAFEGIAAHVVYVPDTCQQIGNYAFKDSELYQIRIPKNCRIGEEPFSGCTEVYIYSSAGSFAEEYCAVHDNCTFVVERVEDAEE